MSNERLGLHPDEVPDEYARFVLEYPDLAEVSLKALAEANDPESRRQEFTLTLAEKGHDYKERSLRDFETGLPNREALEGILEQVAEQAAREIHPEGEQQERREETGVRALVVLDLEDFGEVNNQFGWGRGTKLLAEVAHSLEESLRPKDIVARVGGDEFAVLLDNVADLEQVFTALSRVEERLPVNPITEEPVRISQAKLQVELLSQTDSPNKIRKALGELLNEMRKSQPE